jgi:NADH dehydrogenase FAD-containing subunit
MTNKVVVVGGGYAGVVAAARIARAQRAEVTLVDAREAFTQRIRLHEALAGRTPASFPYARALAGRGVRFVRATVEEIGLAGQTLAGEAAGGRWGMEWDTLVLALGSRTDTSRPGVREHALVLDDPARVREAAERVRALPRHARIVVVGGGATGVETAAELAERYPHLQLTLVTGPGFGGGLSAGAARALRGGLERLGVQLIEDASVVAVENGAVVLETGHWIPCALAVWAAGFRAPALAAAAGLETARDGRVLADPSLRARGRENVYVAGDAAAVRAGALTLRMGCATALPIGAHAGDNVRRALEGREVEPFRFGYIVRCISLGRHDAVIQPTDPDDRPTERFLAGRRGAWVKEAVARSTYWAAAAEARLGLPLTSWKKVDRSAPAPRAPRAAAGAPA